jgi:hypothetical protein
MNHESLSNPLPSPVATPSDAPAPYVSPPSQRGMAYRAPAGYRHDFRSGLRLPGRPLLIGLLLVVGVLGYLRSDRLLPLLQGTTVTRVLPPGPVRANDPYPADPQWSTRRQSAGTVDYPATLPPTSAGVAAASVAGYKCVGADGAVTYRQQRDCGEPGVVPRDLSGTGRQP